MRNSTEEKVRAASLAVTSKTFESLRGRVKVERKTVIVRGEPVEFDVKVCPPSPGLCYTSRTLDQQDSWRTYERNKKKRIL